MTYDELIAYKNANKSASQADAARHFDVTPQTISTIIRRKGVSWPRPKRNTPEVCSFDGCSRMASAKGLCATHYSQMRRGKKLTKISANKYERLNFLKSTIDLETDDCVIWPFASNGGYGHLSYDGKTEGAHRVVLKLSGKLPTSSKNQACHSPEHCSSSLCVNPRHLRWDSVTENQKDQARLRRIKTVAALTIEQVLEMREQNLSYQQLADKYRVKYAVIKSCMDRKTWWGVEPP